MLAAERRKIILEKLQSEKKVVVSLLVDDFGVSDETIRRDLDALGADGYALKIYGGAVLNENEPDLPFGVRFQHNPAEKRIIAGLVEPLVRDGESVIFDASTTALFIAKALKNKRNLSVITNSIEVLVELKDMPEWNVLSSGGSLMGDFLALTGQRAIAAFSACYADKFIFSCKGLDAEHGIFDSIDDLSQVKQAMLRSAATKILAADMTKFDRTAFSKIADFSDIDIIVTDTRPGDRWLDCFSRLGIRCIFPAQ